MLLFFVAERQGFEPWIRLPVCRISSAVHSSTLASLLILLRRHIQHVDYYGAKYDKYGGDNQQRQCAIAQKALLGIAGELFQRYENHQYRKQLDDERPQQVSNDGEDTVGI